MFKEAVKAYTEEHDVKPKPGDGWVNW